MNSIIKFTKVLILLLLMMISANFAINNQDPVAVDLGPFAKTVNIKLHFLTFIVFTLGAVTASSYFLLDTLRKTLLIKKQSKKIKKLEKSSPTVLNLDESATTAQTLRPEDTEFPSEPDIEINTR